MGKKLQTAHKNADMDLFTKSQDLIKKLQAQEQAQREDEHPEDLLDDIEEGNIVIMK